MRVGDAETGDATATDPTPDNNRAVQKIIWGQATGIKDLFAKKDIAEISLYPNPANKTVNFDFDFTKPSHATVFVRDLTGKVVTMRNYGRIQMGKQTYTVDISALSAGNYVLEFDTDEQHAVSKLTIKK